MMHNETKHVLVFSEALNLYSVSWHCPDNLNTNSAKVSRLPDLPTTEPTYSSPCVTRHPHCRPY